jgi:predicted HicB family RNase H-like nuclease
MAKKRRHHLKTAELNVRISPRLKEVAQKAAERDQRSLSSLIERLIVEHCERVGLLRRPK